MKLLYDVAYFCLVITNPEFAYVIFNAMAVRRYLYNRELFSLLFKSLRSFSSAVIDKMTSLPPASIAILSMPAYS